MSANVNIKYLAYSTKPFIYVCDFDEIIEILSKKSLSFTEDDVFSPALTDEFLHQYLDPTQLTIQKSFYRFKSHNGLSLEDDIKQAKKMNISSFF